MAGAKRFVTQTGESHRHAKASSRSRGQLNATWSFQVCFACRCLLWVTLPLIVGCSKIQAPLHASQNLADQRQATDTFNAVEVRHLESSSSAESDLEPEDANTTDDTESEPDNATNMSTTDPPSVGSDHTANVSVGSSDKTAAGALNITFLISEMEAHIANLGQKLEVEKQKVVDLTARVDEGERKTEGLNNSIDTGWLAYNTSLVFLMQLGFALVEAGSVRKKSYRHVFLKNLMDCSVGMALWLLIGYWIAFPGKWEGVFIELKKYDIFFIAEEGRFFAFQTVFASTAITIISGAMAERTRMEAYLAFCGICGALVYAVVVRWTWGGGWLAELDVPYHDFAGSGVVHATGGAAAFVGAALVGPRAGRYEAESSLADDDQYKPHSLDNIVMGTFILWFGWFGFNPGSTTSLIDDSADVAAIAYVNTMICPVFATITVMIIGVVRHSLYRGPDEDKPPLFDLGKICNGVLGGLVGITAGCDAIPVEWTIVVGIISGFGVAGWTSLMVKFKVDDPVDASAVHGCCGVIGVLVVGLFHQESGLVTNGSADLLVTQIKGIAAIVGYVCGTAFVYFYVVYAFGYLRLDMLVEIMGIDRMDFAHIEHVDITRLEIQAVNRYRAKLLDRFQGHLWGISEEQGIVYAQIHRTVTVTFLVLAMVYNYFFYIHFEWRGWNFFSVMNLAVGCQCAAASHAEFICRPGDKMIQVCCFLIIVIGLGLAISNFLIAPHGDLLIAWLRTLTLSFSWSLWMHLRVHPVNWDAVCRTKSRVDATGSEPTSPISKISKSEVVTFFKGMFEVGSATNCFGYLLEMFLVGRFQHIGESTMSYASVTSDLWVGLDELRNHFDDDSEEDGSLGLGLALVCFSLLQSFGTMSRLVVATRKRSIRFFQCVLVITTLSEAPILVLVFTNSNSSLKWVSVFFSSASIFFQMFNLMIAVFTKRKADAEAKYRPQLMDIPLPTLEPPSPPPPKAKVEQAPEREPSEHSVEIVAPPSSSTKKGTPAVVEQVSLIQASSPPDTGRTTPKNVGTPLMTSRTPRMTTPRSLLAASQLLLSVPSPNNKRHSPMHTPRGYTPRLP
mmetsp:Transcript_7042/g.11392  ORF Transcript_7042/g.11392 Transcript_7042/m.11392 type:complete len:1071 (-) Transcript_7042:295-3507(-)